MAQTKANLSWVTDRLAVGGDLSVVEERALLQTKDIVRQGITTVIDLRQEASDHDMWDLVDSVEYFRYPTHDAEGWSIPPELFDGVVEDATKALSEGQKVLVHCHMGINRGPSGGYAVLLELGHDHIEAFDLIRSSRQEAYIDYALDALAAHHRRHKTPRRVCDTQRVSLEKHIEKTFTPEARENIHRAIQKHRRRDRKDALEAGLEPENN